MTVTLGALVYRAVALAVLRDGSRSVRVARTARALRRINLMAGALLIGMGIVIAVFRA